MSLELGIDLWIKRDDLTGFAGGGNKGRKLEYLIADAASQGVDRVVTCGSKQSNFVRQLGAAAAVHGIKCTAVVMTLPYDNDHGKPAGSPPATGGNVVLDGLFGVELVEIEDGDWLDLFAAADRVAEEFRATGQTVASIPVGGSSPLGAYSFTEAALEAGEGWDFIVTPTSSGSTHAGLAWAYHRTKTRLIGVACDPEEDLVDDLERLCRGVDELTGVHKALSGSDFQLRRDWVGAGYNIPSSDGTAATEFLARTEGILLDPVYSAKAFAGLVSMARGRELAGRVLFWHTGGLPTLLAGPRH